MGEEEIEKIAANNLNNNNNNNNNNNITNDRNKKNDDLTKNNNNQNTIENINSFNNNNKKNNNINNNDHYYSNKNNNNNNNINNTSNDSNQITNQDLENLTNEFNNQTDLIPYDYSNCPNCLRNSSQLHTPGDPPLYTFEMANALIEREEKANDTIEQLVQKIKTLETMHENKQQEVGANSTEFLKIQDELVLCKLREAESNLGFKELQQKVHQLDKKWQQFLQDNESIKQACNIKTRTLLEMKEAVMALKIKETYLISDMNELKQRLVELETENHIYKCQEKRQEKVIERMTEEISKVKMDEEELINNSKETERKMSEAFTKLKEEMMMLKIKEAEHCHIVEDMRRRQAELEIENQELLTRAKLNDTDHKLAYDSQGTMNWNPGDRNSDLMDMISRCDMSDIMTESFYPDNMCLQTSQLLTSNYIGYDGDDDFLAQSSCEKANSAD